MVKYWKVKPSTKYEVVVIHEEVRKSIFIAIKYRPHGKNLAVDGMCITISLSVIVCFFFFLNEGGSVLCEYRS